MKEFEVKCKRCQGNKYYNIIEEYDRHSIQCPECNGKGFYSILNNIEISKILEQAKVDNINYEIRFIGKEKIFELKYLQNFFAFSLNDIFETKKEYLSYIKSNILCGINYLLMCPYNKIKE